MREFIRIVEGATGPVQPSIQQVESAAADLGVHLALRTKGDDLWMDKIERTTGEAGAGRQAIELVFDLADRQRWTVRGVVEDYSTAGPLLDYYDSLGFEIMPPDYDEDDEPGAGAKFYEISRAPR